MGFAIRAGAIVSVLALVGAAWLALSDSGDPAGGPVMAGPAAPPTAAAPIPGPDAPAAPVATLPVGAEQDQVSGPGRILGRLLDPDGKAVTGGRITAKSHVRRGGGWKSVSIPAKSDGSGRFLIGNLPAGSWLLDADDGGRSLARPERLELGSEAPEATVTLRLAAGATLAGTVREPDGKPIPGVKLALASAAPEKKGGPGDPIGSREARTDASGRFAFAGLRAGGRFTCAPEHPDYFAREESQPMTVEGDTARDLVLVPFATLGGTVVGPDLGPVAGAEVEIQGLDAVVSDGEGRFSIPRIRADGGTVEVVAATPDLDLAGRTSVPLRPGEVRDDCELRIIRTARIRGRVTDILGKGIPGATVTATAVPKDHDLMRNPMVGTVNSGTYDVRNGRVVAVEHFLGLNRNAFFGSYSLALGKLAIAERPAVAEAEAEAIASAEPPEEAGEQVSGEQVMIFDSRDASQAALTTLERDFRSNVIAKAIQQGTVNLTPVTVSWGNPEPNVVFLPHAPKRPLHERLDGPFTSVTDAEGGYVILGLPSGSFRVSASAVGYFDAGPEHPIVLSAPGDEARADILLHRGAILRGTLSGGGEPPPDTVEITLVQRAEEGGSTHTVPWGPDFEIGSLPAGLFTLRARPGQDSELVAEAQVVALELDGVREGVALEFAPGAEVRGIVKDAAGVPVAGADVTLEGIGGQRQAKSDERGAWRIGGLFGGGANVHAQAEGFLASDPEAVAVPARSRVFHEITLHRGHVVTGRVHDADGSAAAGAMVVLRSPSRTLSAQTEQDGSFRIESVPPDAYIVYCRTGDYSRNARSRLVVERDREPAALDLRLAPGLVARGRVVDAAGVGRADATMLATGADNDNLHRKGQSRPDGSFEIPNLYEGAYVLTVEGAESDPVRFEVGPAKPVPLLTVTLR